MIMPILNYGSQIWGFHKSPDIERAYLKYLKHVLGVRQQTTSAVVYSEYGRFPMIITRNVK